MYLITENIETFYSQINKTNLRLFFWFFVDTWTRDRSSLSIIPTSTYPKVRSHVYKINLLSDAIKYLSTGFLKCGIMCAASSSFASSYFAVGSWDFVFTDVIVSFFFIRNSRRYGTKWKVYGGSVVVCNFGMMHDRLLGECKLKTNIPQTTRYEGVWYKRGQFRRLNGK